MALAIGNLVSIYARNRFSVTYAWKALQQSGIFEDILGYYRFRVKDECGQKLGNISLSDLSAFVYHEFSQRLEKKILAGAAV